MNLSIFSVIIIAVVLILQEIRIKILNDKYNNLYSICVAFNKINENQFNALNDLLKLHKVQRDSIDKLYNAIGKAIKESQQDAESVDQ